MQANQTAIIWTVIIATVFLASLGLFIVNGISNDIKNIEIPDVVTAEAIAVAVLAGMPESTVETGNYDTILDKICESDSIDCEGTYISKTDRKLIALEVFDKGIGDNSSNPLIHIATDDLVELLGLDANWINDSADIIVRYGEKEFDVTTENEDAREDGDFTVKQLIRVTWTDLDLTDEQTAYYVISSTIEDYDKSDDTLSDIDLDSFEEVTRDFEFE